MRLLVDTNVWLDVVLKRAAFADAAAFLRRTRQRGDELWIAWHTVSNMAYILGRAKQAPAEREAHLRDVLRQSRIVPTDETDALHALDMGWKDFEDALQAAAAENCAADLIITGNTADFSASPVAALTPSEFLQRYPAPQP